ncbi:nucleoside 2-deoxyribosyltransferase [Mollisia scopiformis]|uniref:Nucleoside 2-deoxyribosyltransferase n=1 Tax=Mollisia scopiformis TaxID=149040 RepID=A0A194XA36_MOLSC|nr:nucleoside 2-deoxyribosyltransferase [Mollisia scopiformis]KUJ17030.1 nucleoside 2-deoxyribosyltransferase [Mollisia scopiformis]
MKVYLAGPDVFMPKPEARGEELKALCTKHGLEGLFPLDDKLTGFEHGSVAMADAIRTANMELIKSCDAILANMTPFRGPSMDVGTAYEMGVGAALGKLVVGYTMQGDSYVEKVKRLHTVTRDKDGYLRDEAGMSVEEFGIGKGEEPLVDNLMIACGVHKLCKSEEEGVKAIADVLLSKT